MITTVLLAAGFARRFGSQKLLARLPGGESVIAASVGNLRPHSDRLIVVTGADPALDDVLHGLDCTIVKNPRAEEGMGASIAAGIAASRDSDGWLIALADMPFLQPNSVAAVKNALSPGSIVVPACRGRQGHPVGFGSAFGDALAALQGDRGARALLALHPDCVKVLEVADEGILRDIDLPTDLR